jgi:DNA-binding transcriptional MerR regulator
MAVKKTRTNHLHDGKRYMKMKELSEKTGVKAPTIRYYITQGLLPKPYKPYKNVAYYDERYIDLIRLIKKFQKEYFLPLEVIRNAIDDLGYEKAPTMQDEIVEKLFQAKQFDWVEPASVNKLVKPVNKQILMAMSKITEEDLEKSLKIGLLAKDENGCFNITDVRVASLIAQVRKHLKDELGFSFEFISMHHEFVNEIVNKEFNFFLSRILNGEVTIPEANKLASTCIELFYFMFPLVHKRLLNEKIKGVLNIE